MNRSMERVGADGDPFAAFDLDSLLEGAARLRPDRLAFADRFESLSFGEADRRASALAEALRGLGLAPGETVLLAAGAPVSSFIALVAALRARLRVALAPAWSEREAAARTALLSGAAAILVVTQSEFIGGCDPDVWLAAAAASPSARVVCTIGTDDVDGAARLDMTSAAPTRAVDAPLRRSPPRILTMEARCQPVAHAQNAFVAAALDLVGRARIGMRLPILSTLAPTTFAGLAAGPIASLLAGATLRWEVPFEPSRLLESLREAAPAHLIAPVALGPMLARADLVRAEVLASLILLSRRDGFVSPASPPPVLRGVDPNTPIVDLYAFSERALAPEARRADGAATPPVEEPHTLDLDGRRILALDWTGEGASRRLKGAAAFGPDAD